MTVMPRVLLDQVGQDPTKRGVRDRGVHPAEGWSSVVA